MGPRPGWRDGPSLALIGLALAAGAYLVVGTKPWQTGVAAAVAAKKVPPVWDSMLWGWWMAAWAVLLIALTLLATRRWWWGSTPVTLPIPRFGEKPMSRGLWVAAMILLLAATAVHRWPRLSHSLWGDESMAVVEYIQGHYIKADVNNPTGPLRFRRVTWKETVFGDRQMGNNHYLFTLLARMSVDAWRRHGAHERHEFSEAAIRLPALLGGLGLLVALAHLGWRLGAPRAGVLAAFLLALHPWHLRYCTEARGYSLMGLFLCLTLGLVVPALETGTWAAWSLFAGAQFLTLYSCKIAVYPLAFLNLAMAVALWRGGRGGLPVRLPGLGRWFVVNTVSALVFLLLYAPCHAQAVAAVEKIRQRGLNEVSWKWLSDMTSEAMTGIPWHTLTPDNAVQVTWSKLLQGSLATGGAAGQWAAIVGYSAMALALVWGARRLWRQCRPAAWAGLAFLAAAAVSVVHFHEVLKVELLPWYWFFLTPPLCLTAALGATAMPGRWPALAAAGLAGFFGLATAPLQRVMVTVPYEDFRSAVAASRGRHEDPNQRTPSRIFTCWLWRSSLLYDPRADSRVRTLPMLNQRIRAAKRAGGELYVIIGYPWLSASLTPTVFKRVTTSPMFERVDDFPAQVPRHTLTVYRYVGQGETPVEPGETEAPQEEEDEKDPGA